jgi:hypothetical protein
LHCFGKKPNSEYLHKTVDSRIGKASGKGKSISKIPKIIPKNDIKTISINHNYPQPYRKQKTCPNPSKTISRTIANKYPKALKKQVIHVPFISKTTYKSHCPTPYNKTYLHIIRHNIFSSLTKNSENCIL